MTCGVGHTHGTPSIRRRTESPSYAFHWWMRWIPTQSKRLLGSLALSTRFSFRVLISVPLRHFTFTHLVYSFKQILSLSTRLTAMQTSPASIGKEEALSLGGHRHACHVMLHAETKAKLFGRTPIKHIVLVRHTGISTRFTDLPFSYLL